MNKMTTIAINIGIAALIYGAATGAGVWWMAYLGVGIAALLSLFSVLVMVPISAYWALILDTGLRETLEMQTSKERSIEFLTGLLSLFENTAKVIGSYRSSRLQFFMLAAVSLAIPIAILLGPQWKIAAFTILVLDAIAFACLYWLMNNASKVSAVTLEAVNRLTAMAPELIVKGSNNEEST
jgi:hypothetical protein